MRIVSWNVNSIRARLPVVEAVLRELEPDIVCLQELKCRDEAFPYEQMEELGYNCAVFGQKSYNGVAVLSRFPIEDVERRDGDEARYIEVLASASFPLRVASVYCPNGNPAPGPRYDDKLAFGERLIDLAAARLDNEEAFALAGDFNCIPLDEDCHDISAWREDALALPATRAQYRRLRWMGMTDAFMALDGRPHQYTFWDYQRGAWRRDHGVRIDHILLAPPVADRLEKVAIHREARGMDKPSDHVPVYVDLRE